VKAKAARRDEILVQRSFPIQMRILNITNLIPYPPVSGAPLRSYSVLRRVARDHEVYLAAFSGSGQDGEAVSRLREFCREVVAVKQRSLKEALHPGKALSAILRGEPPELRLAFSDELAGAIRRLTDRIDFDVVQIEHGSMGMYLEALPPRLQKRAVWLLHDIDFDKFLRIAQIEPRITTKLRARAHAAMMRRWQPGFAGRFGLCVTMSEADRELLLKANGNLRVEVAPNGVDTEKYRPLPDQSQGSEILFIGNMSYQPNVDAVNYFCRDVFSGIRQAVADAKLWIVGINPGDDVRKLEGACVSVTGSVPDVVPYYQRSKVCVVPIRAGSGTRLKILEAMALGRAVVSTSIGCEGLGAVDGKHILVADDSKRFAEQVVRLLQDSELRLRIAQNAREFVAASYDWDLIAQKSIKGFEGVAARESLGESPEHRSLACECR
jgi:polysaccharide biosynthesis protein PslH